MPAVTSATAASAAATTNAAEKRNTLDYNAFLQLFMAELKNQDPTNPPDSAAFIAQLANFSNVEQAIQTNNKLDALMALSSLAQADNLIGHTITSADGRTSGVVASVSAIDGGAVAMLENGSQVVLGSGVQIS
ncbi:MAG: flagellar hook assembly protein FlgD [Alphaproteobacteria bacterium]